MIFSVLLLNACGDDSDSINGGNDIDFPSVALTQIGALDEGTVTVKVTPDRNTVRYEYILSTEENRAAFENGTLENITVVNDGQEKEYTFAGLPTNEERTLFARAYDRAGRAGAVASLRIDDYTSGNNDDLFWMNAEALMISANVASFEFSISEYVYKGSYCIDVAGRLEDFENDLIEGAVSFSELDISAHTRFDLTPETDYAFYMKGYDRLNNLTVLKEVPFTTLAESEVPGVSLGMVSQDAYNTRFDLIPNANTSMMIVNIDYTDAVPGALEEAWRGNVVGMFEYWGSSEYNGTMMQQNGTMNANIVDPYMTLDMTYNVYVMTYDLNSKPLNFQKLSYSTTQYDSALPKATMSATVAPLPNGGTFTVTPSSNTLGVFLTLYTKAMYDELIEFGEFTDEMFIEDVVNRGIDNADGMFQYGNSVFTATNTDEAVEAGTPLILLGVPVNANGLQGLGDLYKLEFTSGN